METTEESEAVSQILREIWMWAGRPVSLQVKFVVRNAVAAQNSGQCYCDRLKLTKLRSWFPSLEPLPDLPLPGKFFFHWSENISTGLIWQVSIDFLQPFPP
jgi:hypothetical protein